jgi:AraC-like DNA-binding protein
MRHEPRRDHRGILDPGGLLRHVRFRRLPPDPALRRFVEHYWLIDWDLPRPYEQQVLPNPAVNIVFRGDAPGEVVGVVRGLFATTLDGAGCVCGVQFRPGGFRPFWHRPVAELTGRRVAVTAGGPICRGTDEERRAALDAVLLALGPRPDPQAERAVDLVDVLRHDATIVRVADFARREGLSVRALQRLFAEHVGVTPKWVLLRYRLQEAIDQAATDVDWAALAYRLGYSDQAHLVRDFTTTIGLSPTAYARSFGRVNPPTKSAGRPNHQARSPVSMSDNTPSYDRGDESGR